MVQVGDIVNLKNNPEQKFKVTDYKWGVFTITSIEDGSELRAYESAMEIVKKGE